MRIADEGVTAPQWANKIGYKQGLGTETFGQFIFSEIHIYDRLHVLNLKHIAHERQLPL